MSSLPVIEEITIIESVVKRQLADLLADPWRYPREDSDVIRLIFGSETKSLKRVVVSKKLNSKKLTYVQFLNLHSSGIGDPLL
jgi:hypothetical protein